VFLLVQEFIYVPGYGSLCIVPCVALLYIYEVKQLLSKRILEFVWIGE